MGTSTMGSDLHSDKQDKISKLQARKKELEQLLAAKNEELYKLCVQEVQLTGVMPPEAPMSPEVPQRERLGSIRSSRSTDGNEMQDNVDSSSSRRVWAAMNERVHDSDQVMRKNLAHRLSTPSISGLTTKSGHAKQLRRPETNCNFFPSPPQDRSSDTFSIRTSQTYPALSGWADPTTLENAPINSHHSPLMYRHHAVTTDYMNKTYNHNAPEVPVRMRETHFSSSHPDIATTHYSHSNMIPHQVAQQTGLRSTPLLYQYAAHLKAQNHHLALTHQHQHQNAAKRRPDGHRRSTLQRTQTYHLTSHSDYSQHLEGIADTYRPPVQNVYQQRPYLEVQEQSDSVHVPRERLASIPNILPLRERNIMRNHMQQLQVTTDDFPERRTYPDALSPVSQLSGFSQGNFDSVSMKLSPTSQTDFRFKEKQWHETSLDSPTKQEIPLLKRSPNMKWSPNTVDNQAYEVMVASGCLSAMQSPNQLPRSPPILSPATLPLGSPKTITVIEQGKCIPYREETKPFEMSDFYKYSTKFRQANAQKSNTSGTLQNDNNVSINNLPNNLPHFSQEQWPSQNSYS